MRVLLGLLLAVLLVAVLGADEVQGILVKKCKPRGRPKKQYAFPQTAEQCNAAAASLGSPYDKQQAVEVPAKKSAKWMKGCTPLLCPSQSPLALVYLTPAARGSRLLFLAFRPALIPPSLAGHRLLFHAEEEVQEADPRQGVQPPGL